MNVVPAFMPPTWTILAYFHIKYKLLLIPLVIVGALCAILGRITLYHLVRKFFHPALSEDTKQNLHKLGEFVNSKKHITIPLFITYAFIPIPSNHVYIGAALSKINIKLLASSFFVGRLISYSFWVSVTAFAANNLSSIFQNYFHTPTSFITEIIGFSAVILVIKIPWRRILKFIT